MKLKLFKKIIGERGAVEVVESSLVFPLILVFVLSLTILTKMAINSLYHSEVVYSSSENILNDYTYDDFKVSISSKKNEYINKMREKLSILGDKNLEDFIYIEKNLFFNEIKIKSSLNKKTKITVNKKIYFSDYTRKLDVIFQIFEGFLDIEFNGYSLKSFKDKIFKFSKGEI